MEATAVATEEEAEAWVYPNVTYRCSWAYFLGYMLTSSFSCSEIASFVVRWIRWWRELCYDVIGFLHVFQWHLTKNFSHQKTSLWTISTEVVEAWVIWCDWDSSRFPMTSHQKTSLTKNLLFEPSVWRYGIWRRVSTQQFVYFGYFVSLASLCQTSLNSILM